MAHMLWKPGAWTIMMLLQAREICSDENLMIEWMNRGLVMAQLLVQLGQVGLQFEPPAGRLVEFQFESPSLMM